MVFPITAIIRSRGITAIVDATEILCRRVTACSIQQSWWRGCGLSWFCFSDDQITGSRAITAILTPVTCNLFPFLFLIGNSYRNDLISLFTRFIIFSINLLNRLYTFSPVLLWRRRPFHRSSERRLQMIRKSVVALSICLLLSLASLPTLAQSIPTWQPNTAYAVGALVMFNGVEYKCIQAHTSQVGWEPPNVPALWQPVTGGGSGCSAAPSVPTGLAASGTTSSSTTLSWSAASAPTGCSVSSYTVFQNGNSIGTTGSTSFNVTGLAASATFSFSVSASDSFGSSAQSSAISVTTQASSGGGGGGGTCAPAWNATTIYSSPGNLVSRNGVNYKNNFWTQGDDPATHNGGPGSGQPWTSQGTCSACTTIAGAPAKPTASGTTFNSTNLSWPAVTPPANCSITGYTVLKNGSSIGTTTGTTFAVGGLTAQTTFNFSVEANDGAGSSAPSAAVSVTTPACTGTCSSSNVVFAAY